MDTATIIRMLTNSGFNVKGIDSTSTFLIIEDPSCILRNFETFLEYAWIFVSLIAAMLLFGWAISLIRGAKTDIATNIRNLFIMFGVLSVTGPIVNLIYGDDLMARVCHEIKIPLADVQEILEKRNSQLSPNDSLFEGIDIYDSGMRSSTTEPQQLPPPVDVPNVTFSQDPETGETIPIFEDDVEQTSSDAITPPDTPNTVPISTPPQPVSNTDDAIPETATPQ